MDEIFGSRLGLLLRRFGERECAELAIRLLVTARRVDEGYNELLSTQDLSGGRFAALLAIEESPGTTPARLAEVLEVKRATVTGLVDGLVKRELVERGSGSGDRRVQTLAATAAGRDRVREALPLVQNWLSGLVEGIDLPKTRPALEKIHQNLSTLREN